jgi:hypothetical protein
MWRGKEERRRRACGRGDEGDYVVQRRVGFWTNHATSVYGPNGFICSSSISQGKFFFCFLDKKRVILRRKKGDFCSKKIPVKIANFLWKMYAADRVREFSECISLLTPT